jgi:protein involved in polysaccharide export with SLBB domain
LAIEPIVGENYVLQVGDSLLISIYGRVGFSYDQVITPQGNIFIQYVSLTPTEGSPSISYEVFDVIRVAGMTIKEAEKEIQKEFDKYFKGVKVNLTVTRFSDIVYVNGAVVSPDAYPFLPGRTVMQYINLAGGFSESADASKIRVMTKDGEIVITDLDGKVKRNYIIYIPLAYVFVRGAVTTPGAYSYNPEFTVEDYISRAGGPTNRANISKAYIVKNSGEKISVKSSSIGKNETIVVPELRFKWWEDYLTVISAITTVVIAWLTITK